jgi:head-tail adaptor
MRAGLLRHRITIQQPSPGSNAYGETDGWADYTTIWADVRLAQASESGQERDARTVTLEVHARYRADITPAMQLLFGTETNSDGEQVPVPYDIESVGDPEGRRRRLLIRAVARS